MPLADAVGSVLAETIQSPFPLPRWANAGMDGYAARAADVSGATRTNPARLRVVEEIAAGRFPTRRIEPGEAARIFTGAPVPDGADSVIRQEDTDVGIIEVSVYDSRDGGGNVRPPGQDLAAGATALAEGTELDAAGAALLAALAVAHPLVYRRPRVAILAAGDELAALDQRDEILAGRRIASSNSILLAALVREAGGEPVDLGIAHDDPDDIRRRIAGATDCDLLITTGGVSVGSHDELRPVLRSMGAEEFFWRLAIRPGGPAAAGQLGGMLWIGLPGNPVSTFVTFELLARPAIRRLMGHRLVFRTTTPVRLAEPVTVSPALQHFLRVRITSSPTGPEAWLTGPQSSNLLSSVVRADGLMVVPQGTALAEAGTVYPVMRLRHERWQETPSY